MYKCVDIKVHHNYCSTKIFMSSSRKFSGPTNAKAPDLATSVKGFSGAKRKMVKPKMDLAKALAIMGFGTARIVDPTGEKNAQDKLNAALTQKMEDLDKKKKKAMDGEKNEERRIGNNSTILNILMLMKTICLCYESCQYLYRICL